MRRRRLFLYPALTGSNLSVPKAKRQVQDPHLEVRGERLTAHKSPIGSGQQDVAHSGVATGSGVLSLSTFIHQWEPLIEVSLYQFK
ncbi:hypothetical protein AAGS61_07410 [Lysinibacillus sp. KU-BSD001]|uniref:hypothetical protein n=1 Tax=Lysinibacillus sp. KU-BSD001 TaxID=3141328 RepID=UPI0036E5B075